MVTSEVPKRQRLSVDARRSQLVAVGVELIATQSWDDLTMNDIAAAAEVSKPLLYHYFSTKSDLYLAAMQAAADQLSESTRPDPALPAKARLRAALRVHVDWVEVHAHGFQTLLQGGVSGDPRARQIIEDARAETVRRVVHSMDLDEAPPLLRIALKGWVGFLEVACLEWLETPDVSKDELVTLLAKSLPGAIRSAGA